MVRLAGENKSKPKWGSAHAKEKQEKRAHAGEKGQGGKKEWVCLTKWVCRVSRSGCVSRGGCYGSWCKLKCCRHKVVDNVPTDKACFKMNYHYPYHKRTHSSERTRSRTKCLQTSLASRWTITLSLITLTNHPLTNHPLTH